MTIDLDRILHITKRIAIALPLFGMGYIAGVLSCGTVREAELRARSAERVLMFCEARVGVHVAQHRTQYVMDKEMGGWREYAQVILEER